MQIEEAEVIFGKRWNEWTEEEKEEFASVLQPEELVYPIYINFALKYIEIIPANTLDYVSGLIAGAKQRKAK